jgi:phage repressor protein C with HTH and peptisase S24 domain
MDIIDRINKLITDSGLSEREFATKINLGQRSVNYYLKREQKPSLDFVEKTIFSFGLDANWLLNGEGQMLKSGTAHTPGLDDATEVPAYLPAIAIKDVVQEDGMRPVCLYDISAAAGYGNFDEMINAEKVIDRYIVPCFKSIDWMIFVRGSSMYPKYSSGDIIACRVLHESRFIQWGKVYVIATKEQGILVKRLRRCTDENCITAISDNQTYDSFDIPKDEILGIALVVGVIRME